MHSAQQCRCRRRSPLLLLPVLLLLTPACTQAAEFNSQGSWKDKKYLLPILRAGPNNQLRHLRFMLAIAKQLNRTVILTGIIKHYTDRGARYKLPKPDSNTSDVSSPSYHHMNRQCFKEEVPYHIEFSEILDRQYVEQFVPATTTAEMKALGWDGVVDALIYANNTHRIERVIPYMSMTAAVAKVHMYHDLVVLTTTNNLKCNPDAVKALADKTQRFRVLMMSDLVIGSQEVVPLPQEGLKQPDNQLGNTCWTDLFHANRRLKANAWLQGIARRYITELVGAEPFLAMHVRPQADGCWRLWMERKFDQEKLSKKGVCWAGHDKLHLTLGPRAASAMQTHGLNKLIVLTHPNLKPVVDEMLTKVKLTAAYIDPHRVAALAGCSDQSSTFLMLVEMQIAVQSTVFLGTASSSITETVLYERLASGITDNEYIDRPLPKPATAAATQSPPPPALHTATQQDSNAQYRTTQHDSNVQQITKQQATSRHTVEQHESHTVVKAQFAASSIQDFGGHPVHR